MNNLQKVDDWLRSSKKTVVLTGAGMSTESGVPDFRSASGWWTKTDLQKVATVDALEFNYPLFHEFYSMRIRLLEKCAPHEGHHILAKWEKDGILHRIATQNVDGFHFQAGSKCVDELHGSIYTFRCHSCGQSASKESFLAKERCGHCQGYLRPNVVLFGEMLPEKAWQNALSNIQSADLVIVIGTSLEVYPVNQLPMMTKGKKVYINKEIASHASYFDCILEGKAKEVLIKLDELLSTNK
ncbi:SIR2 family NAD-dependent protein deacylase [Ureibacillus terrenus]|uniref:protein acetyllysine N-acetyltransferase n=1 Tax=Ureibacillus terrenus TaxID=118246 RepID=A0A540V144_9BACL|nr:NAD-dependent deacylase [Ureibacillus terrenus]MED3663008.1 NAD-dependent deacylase [Ureibacillus terrenus]MED3765083.1 NAD-dependent deacylase [Ureibacillus terrenus]TQE90458.1 NAD-dependent deacylase [Ureibacillus terrenus]